MFSSSQHLSNMLSESLKSSSPTKGFYCQLYLMWLFFLSIVFLYHWHKLTCYAILHLHVGADFLLVDRLRSGWQADGDSDVVWCFIFCYNCWDYQILNCIVVISCREMYEICLVYNRLCNRKKLKALYMYII